MVDTTALSSWEDVKGDLLETTEFGYLWFSNTGDKIGTPSVCGFDIVLLKILAFEDTRAFGEDSIIAGIMNTEEESAGIMNKKGERQGGEHWVLWTYQHSEGMVIYDPKGHDLFSKKAKSTVEKSNVAVKIKIMDQQDWTDGWSCGYRVLFWV